MPISLLLPFGPPHTGSVVEEGRAAEAHSTAPIAAVGEQGVVTRRVVVLIHAGAF